MIRVFCYFLGRIKYFILKRCLPLIVLRLKFAIIALNAGIILSSCGGSSSSP